MRKLMTNFNKNFNDKIKIASYLILIRIRNFFSVFFFYNYYLRKKNAISKDNYNPIKYYTLYNFALPINIAGKII